MFFHEKNNNDFYIILAIMLDKDNNVENISFN